MFRISYLQKEIYAYKQGDLTVPKYFTGLKILWDEILNYRPLPTCSCINPCNCGAIITFETYQKNDYVIWFLKGLNEKFTNARSQIMLMESLPSINKVFSLVVKQERQMNTGMIFLLVSNLKTQGLLVHLHTKLLLKVLQPVIFKVWPHALILMVS